MADRYLPKGKHSHLLERNYKGRQQMRREASLYGISFGRGLITGWDKPVQLGGAQLWRTKQT